MGPLENKERYLVLDGWRGISILVVLACHLLPLGPKAWQINEAAGPFGMALFFTLSGFLITNFLLLRPQIHVFLVRRLARILLLAWLTLTIALVWQGADWSIWVSNFLFLSNWPPMSIPVYLSPFWSLCVEFQFYIGIALAIWIFRDRGFWLLPFVCIAITLFRIYSGSYAAINTYLRVDEILAGALLALIYRRKIFSNFEESFARYGFYVVLVLFAFSCHPVGGPLNYFRPYLAAILVGITLFNPGFFLNNILTNKYLVYVAAISYSLYLIHPLLAHSWLGEGETFEKYLKRPLLFGVLFVLAHFSTYYYERFFITLSRRYRAG